MEKLEEVEQWATHPSSGYVASSFGRVKGRNVDFLKLSVDRYGYQRLDLNKRGKFYVHRMVVETFISEIPVGKQVNHKDCNKLNNKVSNLEIVTPKENTRHAVTNNLFNPLRGEDCPAAILTERQVLEIRDRLKNNQTQSSIGLEYGVNSRTINQINSGRRWRHLFNGEVYKSNRKHQ